MVAVERALRAEDLGADHAAGQGVHGAGRGLQGGKGSENQHLASDRADASQSFDQILHGGDRFGAGFKHFPVGGQQCLHEMLLQAKIACFYS